MLHRVGRDYDKETVKASVVKCASFKNLYYNIEKKCQKVSAILRPLSSVLKKI